MNTDKLSLEVKEWDVFHVWHKDRNESRHCFEGVLVVRDFGKGLKMYDTFWNIFGGNGGKVFEIEKAIEIFNISYYCNLNDFDLSKDIRQPQTQYIENDFVFLHRQNACVKSCESYFLRKGAKKSKVIMLHALNKKLEEKTRLLTSSIPWDIICINRDIQRVHNGEDVYI